MKTMEQIAQAAGITKAAIYKRFQSYGLSVNQLKAEKQGRAKVYGDDIERLIILMFQPEGEVERSVDSTREKLEAEIKELQGLKANLEVESREAKAEKEKAEERAERAEAQAEKLLEQIDKLTDAIRAAEAVQAAQAAQLARLPAGGNAGFIKRLKAVFTGGKRENEQQRMD